MSEYRRQSAFLRALLDYEPSSETHAMLEHLQAAERNERCLFSACRSVVIIGVIGLFGLGYAAVLLPQFFDESSHFLIQFFSALVLGSLFCLGVFVAVWLWYRATANKVREQVRQMVTRMMDARFRPELCRVTPVVGHSPYLTGLRPGQPVTDTSPASLQKAP